LKLEINLLVGGLSSEEHGHTIFRQATSVALSRATWRNQWWRARVPGASSAGFSLRYYRARGAPGYSGAL